MSDFVLRVVLAVIAAITVEVQKAASAVLMAWAILRGLMLRLAYLVAGFDAITAPFVFVFWRRLAR
jgi:hypothetical protein